jgi:alkylation response protein AidB-like acyl-CoA dehydrogenase
MGEDWFQARPQLANQYDDDPPLRAYLAWRLPADVHAHIAPGLAALGARAAGDLLALAAAAETAPPWLVQYDAWGRRVDRIETSAAWRALGDAAVEEGIVATAYERREGPWSRLHQFVRLYLYHPSSALYSCPLAMTDGAARVLELHGAPERVRETLPRLVGRDPRAAWTSGQWMTERTGGSDVSGTGTEARVVGGQVRLYGTKWFTSAVTSEMALALARDEGGAGLSLYYVETRDADGALSGIRVHRLKDKLGTRAMPTAELTLDGTPAERVGAPGQGVRTVAAMLNVTRLYNACCAAAAMRRAVALARDYAGRRVAFGRTIAAHPLHAATLAALDTEVRAACLLVFELATLLGAEETGAADAPQRALLRLMTPVAKLYTAKQAVAVTSEALECFGGAGYIEDTDLPRLLRDAQVLPIWEGTTNVLSLDVLRVLAKTDAFDAYATDVERRLRAAPAPHLAPARAAVADALQALREQVARIGDGPDARVEAEARGLAYALARCYAGAALVEMAHACAHNDDARGHAAAALHWCARLGPGRVASFPAVIGC